MVSNKTKFVAALEALGGAHGAVLLLWRGDLMQSPPLHALVYLIFISLFLGCVYAGVLLWQGSPQGLRWSKVLFILQCLGVSSPILVYQFISGAVLHVGFDIAPTGEFAGGFNFNVGSSFLCSLLNDNAAWGLHVNVVAVLALVHLRSLTPR